MALSLSKFKPQDAESHALNKHDDAVLSIIAGKTKMRKSTCSRGPSRVQWTSTVCDNTSTMPLVLTLRPVNPTCSKYGTALHRTPSFTRYCALFMHVLCKRPKLQSHGVAS